MLQHIELVDGIREGAVGLHLHKLERGVGAGEPGDGCVSQREQLGQAQHIAGRLRILKGGALHLLQELGGGGVPVGLRRCGF